MVAQGQEALTVPVVGPEGESLAGMKPSRVRRYLDQEKARVVSRDPFMVQLLERKDLTMQPTPMMVGNQQHLLQKRLPSTLIKNVSGGVVRVSDLKSSPEDEGLILQPGWALDLQDFFPIEKINASIDLRRGVFPSPDENGNVSEPALICLTGIDDPHINDVTEGELIRSRTELEMKKPLVRIQGRPSPGRGGSQGSVTVKGMDRTLDEDVQRQADSQNLFDDKLQERIEHEEAENDLASAGDIS